MREHAAVIGSRRRTLLPSLLLAALGLGPALSACGGGDDTPAAGGWSESARPVDVQQRRAEYQAWRRQVAPLESRADAIDRQVLSRAAVAGDVGGLVDAANLGATRLADVLASLEALEKPLGPLADLHQRVIDGVRASQYADLALVPAFKTGDEGDLADVRAQIIANRRAARTLDRDVADYAATLGLSPRQRERRLTVVPRGGVRVALSGAAVPSSALAGRPDHAAALSSGEPAGPGRRARRTLARAAGDSWAAIGPGGQGL